jgi:hypothetical protein
VEISNVSKAINAPSHEDPFPFRLMGEMTMLKAVFRALPDVRLVSGAGLYEVHESPARVQILCGAEAQPGRN